VKYQLFGPGFERLAKGLVENVGGDARITHEAGAVKKTEKTSAANHREAITRALEALGDAAAGEITVVGHRVVHGGNLTEPTLVTRESLETVRKYSKLAPLHNPSNLAGIEQAQELLPHAKQVMVFDTAFHQTLPEKAFAYAVPREWSELGVRRYGFHGPSHQFVSRRAAEILASPKARIISCHLGAGSSVCAVRAGKSVDTSMGFTPLEGLVMGTRSGDLDSEIIHYLHKEHGLAIEEIFRALNKESGLLGVSGVSLDVRKIRDAAEKGNARCSLALEMYAYRVAKYAGAYAAALGGLDAIAFTAGIGENDSRMRAEICGYLAHFGVELDAKKNAALVGSEGEISSRESRVCVLVIPTNEELEIAREAVSACRRSTLS